MRTPLPQNKVVTADILLQRSGNGICLQAAEKQDSLVSGAKVTLSAAVPSFNRLSKWLYTFTIKPIFEDEIMKLQVCVMQHLQWPSFASSSFSILFCLTPINILIFHGGSCRVGSRDAIKYSFPCSCWSWKVLCHPLYWDSLSEGCPSGWICASGRHGWFLFFCVDVFWVPTHQLIDSLWSL